MEEAYTTYFGIIHNFLSKFFLENKAISRILTWHLRIPECAVSKASRWIFINSSTHCLLKKHSTRNNLYEKIFSLGQLFRLIRINQESICNN